VTNMNLINNDNYVVRSITSTNSLIDSKTFLCSEADVLIIILNEKFTSQQIPNVLRLLSSILRKDFINKTLLMLSYFNQNKIKNQKHYFILAKRHSKHLKLYSCFIDKDERIDCALEWKTRQPLLSRWFPLTNSSNTYTNIIKKNPIFIFIGQCIPSVLRQFIDSSQELTRKVIYLTTEEDSTNINFDHVLNHIPHHCTITIHILRLI